MEACSADVYEHTTKRGDGERLFGLAPVLISYMFELSHSIGRRDVKGEVSFSKEFKHMSN